MNKKKINYYSLDRIEKEDNEIKSLKEQLEYLRSNEYLNQVKCGRDFNEKVNDDLTIEIQKALKEKLKLLEEIERLNNIIKNYEINTIPTLEHNIDVLVDSEERLNNIINEVADEMLKELNENHHLSYGVALALRQKLISYKEIKGSDTNENS